MITSLLAHPLWNRIRPFVRLQARRQDGGHRIEMATPTEAECQVWFRLTIPCANCGQMIHPIRDRTPDWEKDKPRNLYLAASCPSEQRSKCCRSGAAHREIDAIRLDVIAWSERREPELSYGD